jgi:hypothetical protein
MARWEEFPSTSWKLPPGRLTFGENAPSPFLGTFVALSYGQPARKSEETARVGWTRNTIDKQMMVVAS